LVTAAQTVPRSGAAPRAEALLDAVLAKQPTAQVALEVRAKLQQWQTQGGLTGPEQELRERVAQHPDDPQALGALAYFLGACDRWDEATPVLTKLGTMADQSVEIYRELLGVAFGQFAEALTSAAAALLSAADLANEGTQQLHVDVDGVINGAERAASLAQ